MKIVYLNETFALVEVEEDELEMRPRYLRYYKGFYIKYLSENRWYSLHIAGGQLKRVRGKLREWLEKRFTD